MKQLLHLVCVFTSAANQRLGEFFPTVASYTSDAGHKRGSQKQLQGYDVESI